LLRVVNRANVFVMHTSTIEQITAKDLAHLWHNRNDLTVIDVRTPAEYEAVHARGAKLRPLHDLSAAGLPDRDQPVYILCKSGVRATQAAEQLLEQGISHPVVVEGGTDAWVAAGLPVERSGRRIIPLDRQMRMFAGSMIFLGALLALAIHPLFAVIPLFMGGGLVFSGLSGLCPMSNVIARMPWNRGSSCGCGS
jgi:rhodanese-related sulfurtransferase